MKSVLHPSCILCSDSVLYTRVGVPFSDHSFLSFAALCFLQLDSTVRVNHVSIESVSIRGQAFLESPLFLQLDSESRPFVPSITEWWNLLERWDPHSSRVKSLGFTELDQSIIYSPDARMDPPLIYYHLISKSVTFSMNFFTTRQLVTLYLFRFHLWGLMRDWVGADSPRMSASIISILVNAPLASSFILTSRNQIKDFDTSYILILAL